MRNQLLNATKVITLAVILSFGLSYAIAWTAPAATPPGGNVDAPINTGSTAQTKAGNLTVSGLDLNAGSITNIWSIAANSISAGTITLTGTATVNDVYITSIDKYASELFPVNLFYNQHTVAQCSSLGGSVDTDGLGNKFCRIAGAVVPSGWTPYVNWSGTTAKSCNYDDTYDCTGARSCTTGSHLWGNIAVETCSAVSVTQLSSRSCTRTNVTCRATTNSIGVY